MSELATPIDRHISQLLIIANTYTRGADNVPKDLFDKVQDIDLGLYAYSSENQTDDYRQSASVEVVADGTGSRLLMPHRLALSGVFGKVSITLVEDLTKETRPVVAEAEVVKPEVIRQKLVFDFMPAKDEESVALSALVRARNLQSTMNDQEHWVSQHVLGYQAWIVGALAYKILRQGDQRNHAIQRLERLASRATPVMAQI